jgi:hypothetical protein
MYDSLHSHGKCLFNFRLHGNVCFTELVSRNPPPWKRAFTECFLETAYMSQYITLVPIYVYHLIQQLITIYNTLTNIILSLSDSY